MMPYTKPKKPLTDLQRERFAKTQKEELQAKLNDPVWQAVQSVRRSQNVLADARIAAEREFLAQGTRDASVECPITGQLRAMHPQKAERIRELMAEEGWTRNPHEPITGLRTLEEITAEREAPLLAELGRAEDKYKAACEAAGVAA
ncbi:hypothetical protein [Methylobacterium sp. 10]|uniref:hypothetical protein n=1 Tax=Methylobacterium sp. 10 TaxID=1101191 RepID=UPI0012DEE7B6|nr:hypothetical protein [Methylobacterium sp. 10]